MSGQEVEDLRVRIRSFDLVDITKIVLNLCSLVHIVYYKYLGLGYIPVVSIYKCNSIISSGILRKYTSRCPQCLTFLLSHAYKLVKCTYLYRNIIK